MHKFRLVELVSYQGELYYEIQESKDDFATWQQRAVFRFVNNAREAFKNLVNPGRAQPVVLEEQEVTP